MNWVIDKWFKEAELALGEARFYADSDSVVAAELASLRRVICLAMADFLISSSRWSK